MMMKKSTMLLASVLAFGVTQAAFADPKQLNNFNKLENSLTNGNMVRVVINLDSCTTSSMIKDKSKTNRIGGMNINKFMMYNPTSSSINGDNTNTVISSTDSILVNSSQYGIVQNRLSVSFASDGAVQFVSEIVDPKAYTVLATNTYTCNFSGQGKSNVSVFQLT